MFGKRLEELRVARDLSQLELSRRSGVDQSTISLYEANKRQPGLPILRKLAVALECGVIDLLASPGSSIPQPNHPTAESSAAVA